MIGIDCLIVRALYAASGGARGDFTVSSGAAQFKSELSLLTHIRARRKQCYLVLLFAFK
jgi:hypothetical protein